jgi:Flp pilus assembly protein TadD
MRRAIELAAPARRAGMHNDLGVALVQLGRIADAVTEFREALRLQPDFEAARGNLDRALRIGK